MNLLPLLLMMVAQMLPPYLEYIYMELGMVPLLALLLGLSL